MRVKRSLLTALLAALALSCTDATGPAPGGLDLQLNLVGPPTVSQAELDAIASAFSLVDEYFIEIVETSSGEFVGGASIDITPSTSADFHVLDLTVAEEYLGQTVTITLIAYGGGIELYRSVTVTVLTDELGQVTVDLEVRYTGPGIRGTVTDDTGATLDAVSVDLYQGQSIVGSAMTEPDGTYVFPNVLDGMYQVMPTPPAGFSFVCPSYRDVVIQTNTAAVADFEATDAFCGVEVLVVSGGDFDDTDVVKTMLDADQTLTNATFFHVNTLPGIALLRQYDVVLLFMNGLFDEAAALGTQVADYVNLGGNLVIASFYWQGRSDSSLGSPGWGSLETIDPFTSLGGATYIQSGVMDGQSLVPHALTTGVTTVTSINWWGGVAARTGTTVVASWTDQGQGVQPFIGYRVLQGGQRIVGVSLFPASGQNAGGDWQQVFLNAVGWAGAAGGPSPE